MAIATETNVTTQVYRVYIKAAPQAIWDAITKPEWTERYGYGGRAEYDLRPGGKFRALTSGQMRSMGSPEVAVDGEVIEADPPRRLVLTWRMVMDPEMAAEGFTRLTYEIEKVRGGGTKLTVTHDLKGAPKLAAVVEGQMESMGAGGGWSWILSDMKTLIETGSRLEG
ncbi:MAG: SRPBCC family protein [Acidobacteriota bacterium]